MTDAGTGRLRAGEIAGQLAAQHRSDRQSRQGTCRAGQGGPHGDSRPGADLLSHARAQSSPAQLGQGVGKGLGLTIGNRRADDRAHDRTDHGAYSSQGDRGGRADDDGGKARGSTTDHHLAESRADHAAAQLATEMGPGTDVCLVRVRCGDVGILKPPSQRHQSGLPACHGTARHQHQHQRAG